MKNLLTYSLALFITACVSTPKESTHNIEFVKEIDSVNIEDLFDCEEIVIPQTIGDFQITSIDRMFEVGDTLFISNVENKQVVTLNKRGEILYSIHTIGYEPDKYVNLKDITIDPKNHQLLLLGSPKRILYYTFSGKYIKTILQSTDGWYLSKYENYLYITKPTLINNKHQKYAISAIDEKSNHEIEFLETLKEIAPYCAFHGNVIVNTGDKVLFTRIFDPSIYAFDGAGYYQYCQFDWKKLAFKKEKQSYKCVELTDSCNKKQMVCNIHNIQESNDYIYFNTNISGLFVASKKSNKVIRYKTILHNALGLPLRRMVPVGNSTHKICFYFPAKLIKSWSLRNPNNTKLNKLAKQITEESNYVLFIYKMK